MGGISNPVAGFHLRNLAQNQASASGSEVDAAAALFALSHFRTENRFPLFLKMLQ